MPEPTAPPLERILGRPEQGVRSIVDLALHRDPSTFGDQRSPSFKSQLTRRINTMPLPAPRRDWAAILCGTKRMYRTYTALPNRQARLVPADEEMPRPVIIYSTAARKRYDAAVMVLLAHRMEPLGAIPAADLALEGFQMRGQFVRYWKRRYDKLGWRPGDMVNVIELRPWDEHDDEEQGAWLLRHLFGEWL